MLGQLPHRDLHKLARKYGSIMYLKLGLMPTIIVSSPEAAELFLKTHDLVFASRPPLESSKHMAYDRKSVIVAPYGNYWRTVRKICTLQLLSNLKINANKPVRDQELGLLIDYIKEAASTAHVAVDFVITSSDKKERKQPQNDLDNLEYLDMVVKETLRLHPVVPLLLPHASVEDRILNGFHIPKNSLVMLNAWAIGRDPSAWTDPEKFFPERFIATNIDLRGRDFQLIPFGSGRRGCPGIQLCLVMVRRVLAQLVHYFDWELPNGMLPTELDMTGEFSFVAPRAKHPWAIPTYRLNK